MGSASRFKQTNVPRQAGEIARVKVVQGPDYGSTYVIFGPEASIGRGDDNDIVIADLKASRRHAQFYKDANGWGVRDLGSANGITYLGKETRHAQIRGNDHITIGETTFEFASSDQSTRILLAPPKAAIDLQNSNAAFEAQRARVRGLGKNRRVPEPGVGNAGAGVASKSNKGPILMALGLGMAALLFFGNESTAPAKKKTAKIEDPAALALGENRDLASLASNIQDTPETEKSAEMFFKAGFREYREKNFLRAKLNFENVLQVSPGHRMAQLYLTNALRAIDEEVEFHLEQGKKGQGSGKLKSAKSHYEAVLRLLYRDPANPKANEAREALNRVEREMKGLVEATS